MLRVLAAAHYPCVPDRLLRHSFRVTIYVRTFRSPVSNTFGVVRTRVEGARARVSVSDETLTVPHGGSPTPGTGLLVMYPVIAGGPLCSPYCVVVGTPELGHAPLHAPGHGRTFSTRLP